MIRVLVAEDSVTARELLVAVLGADPEITVVGAAKNGREVVEMTRRLKPDLITMDVNMPELDGFEATKQIMIETPTPIIIITASVDVKDVRVSMEALRVGALALLEKPQAIGTPEFDAGVALMISTVKSMAGVKVVRHWPARTGSQSTGPVPASGAAHGTTDAFTGPRTAVRLVAMAASTGGPAALARILADIPAGFPAPIVVVQHITTGFIDGLVLWLNSTCALKVKVAKDGEILEPSSVYLAPDEVHLEVDAGGRARLSSAAPVGGFRPSASFLFSSVAKAFGPAAISVILTGMGQDGVEGLKAVRAAGGLIIAQDEASSVVFGMPGAAVAQGLADKILPVSAIGTWLAAAVGPPHTSP